MKFGRQPTVIERTLEAEWQHAEKLRRHFDRHAPHLIVLSARGTSDNAAQFGRYLLEILTGIPVSLAAPSVTTLYKANVQRTNAVVVAISQSGESTDTNLVLEQAKAGGAFTIGVTNESESASARLADHVFLVRAGQEKSVAATKTYTGQLLSMYLLAYALGAAIRLEDLQRIPEHAAAALALEDEIRLRAERYCFMRHAVCIGRGLNYANSFEFALKLMETCYVVAERFSSADLLHGPIAMLEEAFPAFVFGPAGVTWKPIYEMLEKLSFLKAETLLISDHSNLASDLAGNFRSRTLIIPADLTPADALQRNMPLDVFTPIPYIIPAQLLAASLAEVKHLDPDRPRTLSKVTRTV